jgi:hypothetical protein
MRKTTVNRFVIYDMDREQWERSKSSLMQSQDSGFRACDSREMGWDKEYSGRMLSEFRVAEQVAPTQHLAAGRERRRAREVRNRLSEIEIRLNKLLEDGLYQ